MDATLGKRIAQHRKSLGMTQDQLAEKLGITAQAVSKWENDLSCPDITVLPKLADIFGTTTDALLGRDAEVPVCETQIVTEGDDENNGFTYDNGKVHFHWDGAKLEGVGLACWVLLTGIVYLITRLIPIDVSFWNILWPSFLLVLGIFGLFPRFSAFRLGCALVGGYFLADKLHILSMKPDNGIIFAVIILLFGLSLLADALRKHKRRDFHVNYINKDGKVHHGKIHHDYKVDGNNFEYEASFGSSTQLVQLDKLRSGKICTNFGEYTVDLSGVADVENGCRLDAECNFGELVILVPRAYTVIPDTSTSFASFQLDGHPEEVSKGTILLNASVSFGDITVRYL